MALGDPADILRRLQHPDITPAGWFSNIPGATPILTAILSGSAAVGSWFYQLVAYAKAQMRLNTSTDGWLDIFALDYFGEGQFPRLPGESGASYAKRIAVNLLPDADTRAAVSDAIQDVVGIAPRITEPWRPPDTGVWDGASYIQTILVGDVETIVVETLGAFYWDVDTATTPFRWTSWRNRVERFTAFIDTSIPALPFFIDGIAAQLTFYNVGQGAVLGKAGGFFWDSPGSSLMDLPGVAPGEQEVLDAILRTKVEGTQIGFRFTQPPAPVP